MGVNNLSHHYHTCDYHETYIYHSLEIEMCCNKYAKTLDKNIFSKLITFILGKFRGCRFTYCHESQCQLYKQRQSHRQNFNLR